MLLGEEFVVEHGHGERWWLSVVVDVRQRVVAWSLVVCGGGARDENEFL